MPMWVCKTLSLLTEQTLTAEDWYKSNDTELPIFYTSQLIPTFTSFLLSSRVRGRGMLQVMHKSSIFRGPMGKHSCESQSFKVRYL